MKKRTLVSKFVALLLTVLLILPSTVAFAGPEEATKYYDQALKIYQQGDLRKAADLLERAYAEDPNLVYQYNRILALQGLGDFEDALKIIEIYQNPMKTDAENRFSDIDQIKQQLQDSIKQLEEKKSRDEEERKKAEADKKKKEQEELKQQELAAKKKAEDSKLAKIDESKTEEGPDRLVEYILFGTGGAFIATSFVFASGILVQNDLDAAQSADNETEFDDIKSTQASLFGITFGLGTALAAAGGVMWYLNTPKADQTTATLNNIRLIPAVSSDSVGAVLTFSF